MADRDKKARSVERSHQWREFGFQSEFYLARQFYTPKYDQKKTPMRREDFRSTIYWNPSVEIDHSGQTTLRFYNSDQISTFRTIVEGISDGQQVGRTSQTHFTQLPLELDLVVPTQLLTGDRVRIPLKLRNNSAEPLTGRLAVTAPPHWRAVEEPARS